MRNRSQSEQHGENIQYLLGKNEDEKEEEAKDCAGCLQEFRLETRQESNMKNKSKNNNNVDKTNRANQGTRRCQTVSESASQPAPASQPGNMQNNKNKAAATARERVVVPLVPSTATYCHVWRCTDMACLAATVNLGNLAATLLRAVEHGFWRDSALCLNNYGPRSDATRWGHRVNNHFVRTPA